MFEYKFHKWSKDRARFQYRDLDGDRIWRHSYVALPIRHVMNKILEWDEKSPLRTALFDAIKEYDNERS